MTPEVLEEWRITDQWWDPGHERVREYAVVSWWGRRVVMVRQAPDWVWRVQGPDR